MPKKVKQGTVVSDKMEKTIVVKVAEHKPHKKYKKIMQVTVTAILAALICVATMIVQIPIPATGGYANLGDGIILISSFLLPVGCSITAAALGSALADLLLGYVAFIPGTLMIKAFMAFLSWLVLHSFHQIETDRKAICAMIFSGIASEVFMVIAYFGYEAVIMGTGLGAAAGIPGNIGQGICGIIVSCILTPALSRIRVFGRRVEELRK